MAAVLGQYSAESDVFIAHPRELRDLGSGMEELVAAHELVHKLLTQSTLYGYFERALIVLREDAADPASIQAMTAELVELAWQTHEGTASYVELCTCAARGMDVQAHLDTFPDDYRDALAPIIDTLGLPDNESGPFQWLAAVHIAKVALNMPIVEELGTPEKLTRARVAAFAKQHGSDLRMTHLLRALRERDALAYVVPRYSAELEAQWSVLVPDAPVPRTRWRDIEIFDLKAAFDQPRALNITDYAEPAMMRIIAAAAPELPVILGREATESAMLALRRAWSSQSEGMRDWNFVTAGPEDENGMRRRYHDVRKRISGDLSLLPLGELRAFLTHYARHGLMNFVNFIETMRGEVAISAMAFAGFDSADVMAGRGSINSVDSWTGILPRTDYDELLTLRSAVEPYAKHTAWQVPLEVLQAHDLSQIDFALHGTVMRTIPGFDEDLLRVTVEQAAKAGAFVKIRPLTMNFEVIVLEVMLENLPLGMRPVGSPNYVACIGRQDEASFFYSRLDARTRSHILPSDEDDPPQRLNIIWMLLQLAYNFDIIAARFLRARPAGQEET